jgi:hypothetical protein
VQTQGKQVDSPKKIDSSESRRSRSGIASMTAALLDKPKMSPCLNETLAVVRSGLHLCTLPEAGCCTSDLRPPSIIRNRKCFENLDDTAALSALREDSPVAGAVAAARDSWLALQAAPRDRRFLAAAIGRVGSFAIGPECRISLRPIPPTCISASDWQRPRIGFGRWTGCAGVRWGVRRKSSAPPMPRPLHGRHTVDGFQEICMSVGESEKLRPANIIARPTHLTKD